MSDLIQMGNCYVCKKPVEVEEGIIVEFYTEILTDYEGKEVQRTSDPVHPECKSSVDNSVDKNSVV